MSNAKPYKIIGAYDSETTNIKENGIIRAFPILHQLGITDGTPIENLDASNVEDHVSIELYRHTVDLHERLDSLVNSEFDYVPVICCHNLSFDMYALSGWLSSHDTRVLAKSARKPITFTIRANGEPKLVIWDTLIFSQQPLSRMGVDCGYEKALGEWDYELIRTPNTPLTDDELEYARKDVYALLAWLGWWLRRNPDISPQKLGLNVVTKTGVVRERRKVRFQNFKGNNLKQNIGRFWLYLNRTEAPKTDDELYTMQAATRGGFTFCASKFASVPFDLTGRKESVYAFDATSMHPAQMVSHRYPVKFAERSPELLEMQFELIGKIGIERVLERWVKPFPVAFYACFEFVNLRSKKGSLFEEYGILPLASARYKSVEQQAQDEENGDMAAHNANRKERGYADMVVNPTCAFGKLVKADYARLYITELTAWEIWQCYEWDSVNAVHGYSTGRFVRPPDMATVSVMQFYKAKNLFKAARAEYFKQGTISNAGALLEVNIPESIVDGMVNGTVSDNDVNSMYQSLKADLNALFGIEASNEYRRDTVLDDTGISFSGEFGICNAPKNPKAWYQFGQRIVGWSRIMQICFMQLVRPHVKAIVNGDTDSVKFIAEDARIKEIMRALDMLSCAIYNAKDDTCKRVKAAYPSLYDKLEYIGHYELEFQSKRFCASWNKAYCVLDENGFGFTLAGVPTRKRENAFSCFIGINGYADRLYRMGWSFADVCNLLLGYNVTLAYDVTLMNGRRFPDWGETYFSHVTDYLGEESVVAEPASLALYPMGKTLNDTSSADNLNNMHIALDNNPHVNIEPLIIHAHGITKFSEIL